MRGIELGMFAVTFGIESLRLNFVTPKLGAFLPSGSLGANLLVYGWPNFCFCKSIRANPTKPSIFVRFPSLCGSLFARDCRSAPVTWPTTFSGYNPRISGFLAVLGPRWLVGPPVLLYEAFNRFFS
jgi:hypothetical protein